MPELAYRPFKGRTVRVTALDDCCTPPQSGTECAISVFDSFTTVSLEANVEEGETAFERKANGDVCINEKDPDLLQNLTVSITFCNVLAESISMLTGWPVVTDAEGNGVGFDITEGSSDAETAIEIWSGVAGIDCGEGARYGYNLLPCVTGWQLGETLEWAGIDTLFAITLTGTTSGSHTWGTGPYDVTFDETGAPGPQLDPVQNGVHARIMTVDMPPPELTDGCVAADEANGYLYPPVS